MGSSMNDRVPSPPAATVENPPPSFHPVAGDDETTLNPLTNASTVTAAAPLVDLSDSSTSGQSLLPAEARVPAAAASHQPPVIPAPEVDRDRKQPFPSPVIRLEPPPPPAYSATDDSTDSGIYPGGRATNDYCTFDTSFATEIGQIEPPLGVTGHSAAQSYSGPPPPGVTRTPSYYTGLPATPTTTNTSSYGSSTKDFLASTLNTFAQRRGPAGLIQQVAGSLLSRTSSSSSSYSYSNDHHSRNRLSSYYGKDGMVPPPPPPPLPSQQHPSWQPSTSTASPAAAPYSINSVEPGTWAVPSSHGGYYPSTPSEPFYSIQSRSPVAASGSGSPAPAGAPVYSPGERTRRADGVRCWTCGGTGTVSRFIFDRSPCGTCKGIGKWYM